jgi:hypothetical protein
MFKRNGSRSVAFDVQPGALWYDPAQTIADKGFTYPKSYAFDAASGSGMIFLASELELPNVKLVEPLASVTHPRDIVIKTGGGFPEFLSAWAVDYATTGGNQYGLQGTENTDIAMVQTTLTKGVWPAMVWAASMLLGYVDMRRMLDARRMGMPAPVSLQSLLDKGVRLIWGKALDRVTYLGWNGQPGLCNSNSVITSSYAPNGASGSGLWSRKTTSEILNDINFGLLTTQQNSGYDVAGIANRLLVDYERWSLLNQPMTIGGFNSLLEYVLANNVAKRQGVDFQILPLPDAWISTQGTGTTSRAVFYRNNDDEAVYLQIPQPIQKVFTVPSVKDGGAYETLFNGCIGVVQWLRPQTAYYLDRI